MIMLWEWPCRLEGLGVFEAQGLLTLCCTTISDFSHHSLQEIEES